MEVAKYNPDKNADFLELVGALYGANKNFDYFFNDLSVAYAYVRKSPHISFVPLGGYTNGRLAGHVAFIRDDRRPVGEAFFGFLETPNDEVDFSVLWNSLVAEARARGVHTLLGPINGSIWHQYRCLRETDGSHLFKAEPISKPYYRGLLVSQNPSQEITYFSAQRSGLGALLRLLGTAVYARMTLSGFSIRAAHSVTAEELRMIMDISKKTFHTSWGYTELSDAEFFELYSSAKLSEHLNTLYLLYRGDVLVGFLSTAHEDKTTLIAKTICVLPEFQGKGLGNALAYRMHEDAEKEGVQKIIYALIREGNKIKNFPKDGTTIFRRYSAFEFHI